MRRIDRPGNEHFDEPDLSIDNLNRLIATMPEWSMKRPWTPEQLAAWRLHWFGKTPEQDAKDAEEFQAKREQESRNRFDRYREIDREPFTDWPNGMGTYD